MNDQSKNVRCSKHGVVHKNGGYPTCPPTTAGKNECTCDAREVPPHYESCPAFIEKNREEIQLGGAELWPATEKEFNEKNFSAIGVPTPSPATEANYLEVGDITCDCGAVVPYGEFPKHYESIHANEDMEKLHDELSTPATKDCGCGMQGGEMWYCAKHTFNKLPAIGEEWIKDFYKRFRIMEQVNSEEVDGIFALESDRQKVRKFIAELLATAEKRGFEEGVVQEASRCELHCEQSRHAAIEEAIRLLKREGYILFRGDAIDLLRSLSSDKKDTV